MKDIIPRLLWTCAGVLVFAAMLPPSAIAEGAGVHTIDRVTISAPGWRELPLDDAPEHFALVIESEDLATGSAIRCRLTRTSLPAQTGMTQEIINNRALAHADELMTRSAFGQDVVRLGPVTVIMVDGVATVDAIGYGSVRAGANTYAHGRLFLLVQPDGSGLHYSLVCWTVVEPTDTSRLSIDAVVNSLRIDR